MDKGPSRIQRPETKQAPVQSVEPVAHTERVGEDMSRTGYSRQQYKEQTSSKSAMRFIMPFIIGGLIIVIGVIGWLWWSASHGSASGIDSSKYQVVSLSDGQVYFGTLSSIDNNQMKLTDVYYLQPLAAGSDDTSSDTSDLQDASTTENNFKLVKFTDIVYGPEDEMIISRDQVVHYDNLSPEGKVAKAIEEYKNSN